MSKLRFDLVARKIKQNQGKLLTRMGIIGVMDIRENFDNQSFDGKRWKPKQKPDGRPLLVKTGRLKSSARILSKNANSVTFGTTAPYGDYHNKGTARLPKRQFVGMTKRLQRKLDKEVKNFLRDL